VLHAFIYTFVRTYQLTNDCVKVDDSKWTAPRSRSKVAEATRSAPLPAGIRSG